MNTDSGTISHNGSGSSSYLMNISFTPAVIFFFVSGRTSGDTEDHMAIGYYHGSDGTVQASAGKSSETRSKTLSHYAGTVEKINFVVTGVSSGQFDITYTSCDVNYNIHWLALG